MTTEIDYAKCLVFLNPEAEWAINGNDYSTLEWFSDGIKPTEKQIIAAWPAASAAYQAKVTAKEDARTAVLERLGITQDEVKILLS